MATCCMKRCYKVFCINCIHKKFDQVCSELYRTFNRHLINLILGFAILVNINAIVLFVEELAMKRKVIKKEEEYKCHQNNKLDWNL